VQRYLVVLAAIFLISSYVFAEGAKTASVPLKKGAGTVKKVFSRKNCVMMKYGKMMMIKDGYIMLVSSEAVLPNGTTVKEDGTCFMKDGTKLTMLKEGDSMDLTGMLCRR
jgi:hypothetical protein